MNQVLAVTWGTTGRKILWALLITGSSFIFLNLSANILVLARIAETTTVICFAYAVSLLFLFLFERGVFLPWSTRFSKRITLISTFLFFAGFTMARLADLGIIDTGPKQVIYLSFVAIFEEYVFRFKVMNTFKDKPLIGIIVSSSLFAGIHAINLLSGLTADLLILQLAYAFVVGLLLSCLLLTTSSIILVIIVHFLLDLLTFGSLSPLYWMAMTFLFGFCVFLMMNTMALVGTRGKLFQTDVCCSA